MTKEAGTLIGREFAMEARALMEGWEVPPQMRTKILARIAQTLLDPNTSVRDLDRIDRILARNTRLKLEIEKMILDLEADREASTTVNVQVNTNSIAYLREARNRKPVIDDEYIARLVDEA